MIPPYRILTCTDAPSDLPPESTSNSKAEPEAVDSAAEAAADATFGEGEALHYSYFRSTLVYF
jgi:hypothetical protein